MTRRTFVSTGLTMAAASHRENALFAAPPRTGMGVATTSYMTFTRYRDPVAFLDHCHDLGAGGVQMQLPSDPASLRRIRARAEELGMYLEAMAPMPKSSDTTAFEAAL